MFALIGAAGIWTVQHWAHREQLKQTASAVIRVAGRISPFGRPSPAACSRRPSRQHPGRGSAALKDGALVCFQDRTGQVAMVQPYGSGASWQLAVTCASHGCSTLPHGAGSLSHVAADAVFLVRQVGTNYAFLSLGAEGRYLSAVRDLSSPPVLDSTRLAPATQWRVSGNQGITNAHHVHKKLNFTIHELKAVHLEAISNLQQSIKELMARQADKLGDACSANKSLQAQLQDAAKQLAQAKAEYEAQVSQLGNQLGEACVFNSQLTALVAQKDVRLTALKEKVAAMKHKYTAAERELSAAYAEVASLQAQLADRDEDVTNLHDRICSETRQWDEMRATLQDSLAAKDEEIASLALQLQRMEAALRAVERMLYGMRKPTRLDRASLDAVSIHQLQAAVDNFAAVGEAGIMLHQDMMAAGNAQSPEEAEALRVLFQQQADSFADVGPGYDDLEAEPGLELSVQDLDQLDQSPKKQAAEPYSQPGVGSGKQQQQQGASHGLSTRLMQDSQLPTAGSSCGSAGGCGPGSTRKWAADDGGARELLPSWRVGGSAGAASGRDPAVGNSRGARSSAASEGVHRYSEECSDGDDDDSQDGSDVPAAAGKCSSRVPAAPAAAPVAAVADDVIGAGDDDVLLCHSMDEQELQQQLGKLKASASQFKEAGRCRNGGAAAAQHQANPQQAATQRQKQARAAASAPLLAESSPGLLNQHLSGVVPPLHANLHRLRHSGNLLGDPAAGAGMPHPSASLSQLSPVKEEVNAAHHPPRSKSSTALAGGSSGRRLH